MNWRESAASAHIGWAFVALCVASAAARVIGHVGMVKLGQGAVAQLSLHVVRRTLELPLRAFETLDISGLLAALTEDIVLIANALVGVPQLCINVPIVIACLAYIGWLSPWILVCGVLLAAPAIAGSVALSAHGVGELRRARESQDALVGHFRTLIDGFRELKLHRGRRAAYLVQSLEPTIESARNNMVRGLTSFAVAEGWGQLAFFGFIAVLLFVIPRLEPIERPALVSAVLVVLYLMGPLDIILTWLPILGRARVSLQKVDALIPTLEGHSDRAELCSVTPRRLAIHDSISVEGVTFTYGDSHGDVGFTLGPLDLTLRPGELVVLAGGNGSGKTTLVKLISGLYLPTSGILRVDGRVLSDTDREAYRQLFSVVYADGYVFPNLHGLPADAIEVRASRGLERLGLASQVFLRAGCFSTTDLSQGQRRRLALLGAWLEDRAVCIFDEWAANQDAAFKQVFYDELLPELRAAGKALLVISHDERHFDEADRVIRLHDGRLLDDSVVEIAGAWAADAHQGVAR